MTEPKSTDRSALVGRLRKIASRGERGYETATIEEAAALIESPPAGLTENISEQLDLLVACAKPASGQNSARVAAGLVRDYIADLIRERDEAITRLSQPSGEEIREAAKQIAFEFGTSPYLHLYDGHDPVKAAGDVCMQIAAAIGSMSLPLSSGSNKSDEGKKGQPGK